MTNERHHWEYEGISKTKNLDTYVTFKLDKIKDENGKTATAPKKNESFSLRILNKNSKKPLYIIKEKD